MNTLIQQELGKSLIRELEFPLGVFCTITKVDTSPDLRYASVFLSIFPEKKRHSTFEYINRSVSLLEKRLHQALSIKIIPRLRLELDETEMHAQKVEDILLTLHHDDPNTTYDTDSSTNISSQH